MVGFQILGNYLQAGSKPVVPDYVPTDMDAEQAKTIAGNQAALPVAENLTSDVNAFHTGQIQKTLASIPGYADLNDAYVNSTKAQMAGQLTPEEIAADERNAANWATGSGVGAGSGMAGARTMRDLGLDVHQQISQGLSRAQQWMQQAQQLYTPGLMNVGSMFQTLGQRVANTRANNEGQMAQRWLQSRVNAMPDPTMYAVGQGINAEDAQIASIASSVVGAYAGGGGGGKAMAPSSGGPSGGWDFSSGGNTAWV